MSSKPSFLSVPLEIRHQIYSHLLINESIINIATHAIAKPLRNGMIRSCWQIFHEMLEYYYASNTFLISLFHPLEATPNFLQHLGRVQHLQIEIGDLRLSPEGEGFSLHLHTQQRWDRILEAFFQAWRSQQGRCLKSLVAIDRCGTSIVSE